MDNATLPRRRAVAFLPLLTVKMSPTPEVSDASNDARDEAWARTLHEHVAQYVTALTLGLAALRQRCADNPDLRKSVESLESVAEQMGAAMYRAVAQAASPVPSGDAGDLAGDLARIAAAWSDSRVMRVRTHLRGLERAAITPRQRKAISGIVKEAVTNAARHAGVRAALVRTNVRHARLRVVVQDKGSGFSGAAQIDPTAVICPTRQGHGIRGMHAHARDIGARLLIRSAPGVGTTVLLDIPVQEVTK